MSNVNYAQNLVQASNMWFESDEDILNVRRLNVHIRALILLYNWQLAMVQCFGIKIGNENKNNPRHSINSCNNSLNNSYSLRGKQ